MEISITEPKKVGDGMGAYMAYKVNTKVCHHIMFLSDCFPTLKVDNVSH